MALQFSRQLQVGIKIEAEEGVEESLAAADFALVTKERATYDLDIQRTDRAVQKASLSKDKMVPGHRGLQVSGMVELAGGALATPPKWHDFLRSMGFDRQASVKFLTITSVTDGPFRVGQLIGNHATLGSATATGRVLMQHTSGATLRLFYLPITGTFSSSGTVANYEDTQTSATVSAGPANGGWVFTPQSQMAGVVPPSATAQFRDGGEVYKGVGCRGTGSIRWGVGETAHIEYTIQGPLIFDEELDPPGPEQDGFVPNVTTPPAPAGVRSVPLVLRYAGDDYYEPVLPELVLQINNTIASRPCVTTRAVGSSGRMPALITDREIALSLAPEADFDAFNIIAHDYAADTFEVGWHAGSPLASGGATGGWAPAAHTTGNMAPGDRDGIRTREPSIRLTGDNDDELILFHLLTA